MSTDRELDVVVFGATGFVGRLTADYLARHAPAGTAVGLAGRSRERLASLRDELPPAAAQWPVLVADSTDLASLADLATTTRVVATTVGPYAAYGLPLVDACATAGTHYADLTGEVLFVRTSIDRFDEMARRNGARIVHSCGFDSIPSDLGVLALRDLVADDGAGELAETTLVVTGMRGGVSGGTLASMVGQFERLESDRDARRLVNDPYALSPQRSDEPDLGREADLRGIERDTDLGMWLAPFVMAGYNSRIVRRSNALTGWSYGRGFRYREVMGFPDSAVGLGMAAAVTAGLAAAYTGLSVAPIRSLAGRFLPSPGEGPSEKNRSSGYFRIEIHARTSTDARYCARVAAKGDPGYAGTAVMLGEAALALALDGEALPAATGVLTPATGLGLPLVQRLRAQGFTFDVERR